MRSGSCSPYNVNSVALACLPEALADKLTSSSMSAEVCEGRERLNVSCRNWVSHSGRAGRILF